MEIKLSKAGLDDVERLCDIQSKAFADLLDKYKDYATNPANESLELMRSKLQIENRDAYFIFQDDTCVGMIIIVNKGVECTLVRIAILPEYQNQGLGQKTIKIAENMYPKANTWILDTILQEEKLCYLYEKMGYLDTGKRERIKEGMDLILYYKQI